MAQIDYDQLIDEIFGWPDDLSGPFLLLSCASNVFVGTNPPYSATDLFALFPKFGGTPLTPTGTVDGTTATITNVSSIAGLLAGQYLGGFGIPAGATLVSASGSTVVISAPTTQAGNPVQLTVYANPIIPTAVLNAYIALASAQIMQRRWLGSWTLGMGLFIAHYLTLWAMGQASNASTAAQIATRGLAIGIQTSKAAGDVSVGSTALSFDEQWGAYQLTIYGQQFATLAAGVGGGGMLIY